MMDLFSDLLGWLLVFSSRRWLALLAALLVAGTVPYLLKAASRAWRIRRAFSSVPCDPEQHWLMGHAPKIAVDVAEAFDMFLELGVQNEWKSFKVCIGPMFEELICVHPDAIQQILKSEPKVDLIYHPLVPWLGEGLLIANGKKWSRNRRLLTPAFHYDILKPYTAVYKESVDTMLDLWSQIPEGKSFDVFPYISLLTLDVMLRCTCSFESNCQVTKTHSPYIKAVYQLSDLVVKRVMFFPAYYDWVYALTLNSWRYKKASCVVHKFSMEVIQKRRAVLEEKKRKGEDVLKGRKSKYVDFLDILLEAKDENGVGLTDEEIQAEVDTFMFEGHDTTASGLAWTMYNLAKHPEHQEKCRQEVDAIFEKKGSIEWGDLKSLTYITYCLKESLRLFPPVSLVGRCLTKPTEIDGRVFPEGTEVYAEIYGAHRHPDVWDNPLEFKPLRFAPENSKMRAAYSFLPFSAGPRNCIGQEFALNEERVVLANVLRRFELSLDQEHQPQEKEFAVILRPKNGLYLKLKHRKLFDT